MLSKKKENELPGRPLLNSLSVVRSFKMSTEEKDGTGSALNISVPMVVVLMVVVVGRLTKRN